MELRGRSAYDLQVTRCRLENEAFFLCIGPSSRGARPFDASARDSGQFYGERLSDPDPRVYLPPLDLKTVPEVLQAAET
jgi:hypothetical protein